MDHRIPFLTVAGSPADIGAATGRLVGAWLKLLVQGYPAHYRARGHDYRRLRQRGIELVGPARRAFPEVIREYEVAARAAGVSFPDAWFAAVEEDVTDELDREKCTTVILSDTRTRALIHNEDYDGRHRGMVAVQTVRPTHGTSFARFVYPSGLPGSTCGVNAAGLAFAEDSLHVPVDFSGVTKNVLFRRLLEAKSLRELVHIIKKVRPSNGFALNVVSARDRRAFVIERTPSRMAILPVTRVLVHANNAMSARVRSADEKSSHHSRERRAALEKKLRIRPSVAAAIKGLSDPHSVRSPYRSPSAYMTIATVAIDFTQMSFGIKRWGDRAGWTRRAFRDILSPL